MSKDQMCARWLLGGKRSGALALALNSMLSRLPVCVAPECYTVRRQYLQE
jgi:hypothetical protein